MQEVGMDEGSVLDLGTDDRLGRILGSALWRNVTGLRGPDLVLPPYYAVVYALAGDAYYRDANGFACPIRPGDLILLFRGFPVLYGAKKGTLWSEFWITFTGPVFELWESLGILARSRPVHHLEPIDFWLRQFQSVASPTERTRSSQMEVVCELQGLLCDVLSASGRDALSDTELEWLSVAKERLESDAPEGVTLSDVARALGVTPERFRKRFTRLAGLPPGRYRTRYRMERACRLLLTTRLLVKEIAYELGFANEFHFSHRFKDAMGQSPQTFRQAAPVR
jgi:AraC-like DNA-binding protein